jgi:hypothetical protein
MSKEYMPTPIDAYGRVSVLDVNFADCNDPIPRKINSFAVGN